MRNPHLLTLALTTPLEHLLELPNAVRIAASAREDLRRFSTEQLEQMLAGMDAAITDAVALVQSEHGSGPVSRGEQRDLDWFIEAGNQAGWPRLNSAAAATEQDYFLVLALYKLGEVIDATAGTPPVALGSLVVATLMEALESWMLAGLLPESPSTEQIILVRAELPGSNDDASALDDLVTLARAQCQLHHDADRNAVAVIPMASRREVWRVYSSGFEDWLRAAYWRAKEKGVPETTMKAALAILPTVLLAQKQRMADFERLGEAVARALGSAPGAFQQQYAELVRVGIDRALESNPVAQALDKYIADRILLGAKACTTPRSTNSCA